ncbi:class I SAM-dependent methyltransferase [Nocardioides sp. Root140]|uniref:class I SAM-dependent methyltransferase n=1 Tax=Nocardioides sp. Root140 TaxID=1736460 RepID=UPI0006F351C6|nr:methyltransferase domain-containing protein [Nocardioides sp. Root140]KQY62690.1 hypothetical protein ASD30_23570 [Nocardioides sp. Root140]
MDHQRAPQDRPAFPAEAVQWLLGSSPRTVVVLGDADVAEAIAVDGHDVTDVEGTGEPLPFPDRSIDVVLSTHGVPDDLEAIARVLRPGGQVALVCNERDQRIPWARKLDGVLGNTPAGDAPAVGLVNSTLFGFVSDSPFRYWQVVNRESLEAMVRVELSGRGDTEIERRTTAALALYDDYGRGADGMQMPWLSRCFKATVVENAWAPPHGLDEQHDPDATDQADDSGDDTDQRPPTPQDGSESDLLLIDFR